MENFDKVKLNKKISLKKSWILDLSKKINTTPSLYLKAGAIHGCVLCKKDKPLIYMEDVGRHNAIDKIAGYMFFNKVIPDDKTFYTTGRLTSEMVIKSVNMRIPIVISRSGFTAAGVELARKAEVGLAQIRKLEQGNHNVSFSTIKTVCKTLDADIYIDQLD